MKVRYLVAWVVAWGFVSGCGSGAGGDSAPAPSPSPSPAPAPAPGGGTTPSPASLYSVKDVGALGSCSSTAHGLNNLGQVVGESPDANFRIYAFATNGDGAGIYSLGVLPGRVIEQPASTAQAINDAGVIVGNIGNGSDAFLVGPGQAMSSLRTLTGASVGAIYAWGINAQGRVTGQASVSGYFHAFITGANGSGFTDIGTFPNPISGNETFGYGVNASGQVVGGATGFCTKGGVDGYSCGSFLTRADGSGLESLGVLGAETPFARSGSLQAKALAINDNGLIVGYSDTENLGPVHAFVKSGTAMKDLGAFGGTSSRANAVNNAGTVVGQYTLSNGKHSAFLWTDAGGMVDLNTLIDPTSGWGITDAVAINDKGQIAVNADHPGLSNCQRALLLTKQ